jgi:hypothetical protein
MAEVTRGARWYSLDWWLTIWSGKPRIFPGKIDGFLSVFPKKYSELPIEFAQFLWQDPRNHIQMVKNVRYQNSPRRRPTSPLRSIFLGGSIIHIQMQKWIFTYSIPPSTDSWYWSQQITIFSYVLIFSHIFSLPNRPKYKIIQVMWFTQGSTIPYYQEIATMDTSEILLPRPTNQPWWWAIASCHGDLSIWGFKIDGKSSS